MDLVSAAETTAGATALGLAAAVSYGAADFLGGLASRKTNSTAVVLYSQAIGFLVLLAALPLVPGRWSLDVLAWGIAGGVAGSLGIGLLYAAFAVGRMGIVSPITAVVGAAVPVVVGLVIGERLSLPTALGIACALPAVWLISSSGRLGAQTLREPGVALALGSGAAIGLLYVCLAHGGPAAGLLLLVVMRITSVLVLFAYARGRGPLPVPAANAWTSIAWAGILDMGANVLYRCATLGGQLIVPAVLTSLYPAATVALAFMLLHERLERSQWAGIALAFVAVALIALHLA